MSFAGDTKNDLCAIFVKKPCCRRALLLGLLRASYLFAEREIRFTTRNFAAAELTVSLLAECFAVRYPSPVGEAAADASYPITLLGDDARRVYDCFAEEEDGWRAAEPEYGCPSCRTAFLRGIFLSCGNVTDPDSCYHLDLVLSDDAAAEKLGYMLEDLGLPPKHTARKGMPILYYKESEAVEDFLTTVGATKASLAVMDKKIFKDLRNNANRVSNCELANIGKTVGAATVQYEAIRSLMLGSRFGLLPAELQETARLRYENPELPLKELAELHEPPLTKSGLNHRLRKIVDFAEREK